MKIVTLLFSLMALPALVFAQLETDHQVVFDMDVSKEGLEYLNITDDVIIDERAGLAGALTGMGDSSALEVKDRVEAIPLFMRPFMVPVFLLRDLARPTLSIPMLPIAAMTNAEEPAHKSPKFITNHPTGRPGDAASPSNREYLRDELQRFTPEEQKTLQEMFRTGDSMTQAALTMPEIKPYDAQLPDKVNTNHATVRSNRGGRGNARVLYPAHPNSP